MAVDRDRLNRGRAASGRDVPARRAVPGAGSAQLVGLDGPAVVTSARLAHVVAPVLRGWLDARHGQIPSDLHAELTVLVESLEVARAAYHQALMSAETADDGHSLSTSVGTRDAHREVGAKEAGHLLGLSPRQVTRLIESSLLQARKVGRTWLVDVDSIEALTARRSA